MRGPVQITVREFGDRDHERERWYQLWYAWIEGEQPGGIVEGPTPLEAIQALVQARGRDLGPERSRRLKAVAVRPLPDRVLALRHEWASEADLELKVVLIYLDSHPDTWNRP
jgi:hypothetical protein